MIRRCIAAIATLTVLALVLPGLASGQAAQPAPSGSPCPQKPLKEAAPVRKQADKQQKKSERQKVAPDRSEKRKAAQDQNLRPKTGGKPVPPTPADGAKREHAKRPKPPKSQRAQDCR